MLGKEIHAFVRENCVSSCQGECLPPCCFKSLICCLDLWLSSLLVAFSFMCFSSLEKLLFFKLDSFSTDSRQILFLSSPLSLFLIDLDRFSIHQGWLLLDSFSIAYRSIKIILHALFFTCFASFFYLVIHSIFFHYIHAFLWIPCAPLIILDHLYVSRVRLFSFLHPLLIMEKRGRKCGFFLRFYMLGGEIYALVRERCVSSCQGECLPPCCFRSFFQFLVHRSCDHVYIHCAYL